MNSDRLNSRATNSFLRNGLVLSLYLIAITFPLPFQLSNPWIVVMVIFWLFEMILRPKEGYTSIVKPYRKLFFLSFLMLFAWTAISLGYTENIDFGLKNLEGKLSLLAFPIVLFNFQLKRKEVWNILKAFVISISLSTAYLLLRSFLNYNDEGYWLTYHDFVREFGGHAVFYSYYLFITIVLSIYILLNQKNTGWQKWAFILAIVISLIGLLFCASKNVTVVSIFFGAAILLRRYFKRGITLRESLMAMGLAVLLGFLAMQLQPVKNRMAELFSGSGMEGYEKVKRGEKVVHDDINRFNGTSVRMTFWYIGISEVLREERVLIGLSPGDRRDQINQRYEEVGLLQFYKDYNLHNQFIQTFVELGLIGLLIYLLLQYAIVAFAVKNGNSLLLIFILATLIFQMTESVLERNKGIVFFVFFLCFLQQINQLGDESRHTGD